MYLLGFSRMDIADQNALFKGLLPPPEDGGELVFDDRIVDSVCESGLEVVKNGADIGRTGGGFQRGRRNADNGGRHSRVRVGNHGGDCLADAGNQILIGANGPREENDQRGDAIGDFRPGLLGGSFG